MVDDFQCGEEPLDRFLVRYALPNQQANASQTYLGLADESVIGFYTLVVGEARHEDTPERLTKGLVRHPVPIMLLARLAVRSDWEDRGVGSGLLRDSIGRTLQAADMAGIRAFTVHARNETARSLYGHFGFAPSPTDPLHLFALINDLRRL